MRISERSAYLVTIALLVVLAFYLKGVSEARHVTVCTHQSQTNCLWVDGKAEWH